MRLVYSGVFLLLSGAVHSAVLQDGKEGGPGGVVIERDEPYCLNADARQNASTLTGQEKGTEGIKDGQSPSDVNAANFINYCSGFPLTNGKQHTTSTCNGIPMGRLPAKKDMISSIIVYPQPGDRLAANTTFNVTIQTRNLRAGFLVNPSSNYYTAPQQLDEKGHIIGHCHVTIQNIGSFRTMEAPDAGSFAFFKGIDDAGDGNGKLSTSIPGGLPAGVYRLCTMIAARNHQPVTMPVAQRGAQDDCTKFEVVAAGNEAKPNASQ